MDLREERDPGFWNRVANHPEVAPHVLMGHGVDFGPIVSNLGVLPLASEHGGFLFSRLDALGRCWELHTLYTPEGWGREVLLACKAAFRRVFEQGDVVVTYEVEGWWRSRPPKSFGFTRANDFRAAPDLGAALSTWVLTKAAWEQSPACRRA